MEQQETELPLMVLCAAIRLPDGTLWTGLRHRDIIKGIVESTLETPPTDALSGFVDTKGNFLTRAEALPIACRAGQLQQPSAKPYWLQSEDIY